MTRLDRTGIALALVGIGVAAGIIIQGNAPTVTMPGTSRVSVFTVTQPPATVTVTATVRVTERVSRSQVARGSRSDTQRAGSSANATLACIRKHESGNNYQAVNATGRFQGAYQLHAGYAPAWAVRYGQGAWSGTPVAQWPPSVQDTVALGLGRDSHWGAWSKHTSYHCPGF